jgi:hypothetical protein
MKPPNRPTRLIYVNRAFGVVWAVHDRDLVVNSGRSHPFPGRVESSRPHSRRAAFSSSRRSLRLIFWSHSAGLGPHRGRSPFSTFGFSSQSFALAILHCRLASRWFHWRTWRSRSDLFPGLFGCAYHVRFSLLSYEFLG